MDGFIHNRGVIVGSEEDPEGFSALDGKASSWKHRMSHDVSSASERAQRTSQKLKPQESCILFSILVLQQCSLELYLWNVIPRIEW